MTNSNQEPILLHKATQAANKLATKSHMPLFLQDLNFPRGQSQHQHHQHHHQQQQ